MTIAGDDDTRRGEDPWRVLIVTDDVLTTAMAGPAIRAWHIAEALATDHRVRLVTTTPLCERRSDRFEVESADQARFAALEQWCDVVILQGHVLNHVPVLRSTGKIMLVDLYDPLHFEALELSRDTPEPDRSVNIASTVRTLNEQLARGDFFVCASERQRDLWLGFLSATGRLNPATYADDPTLRRLIDVVPFGLPDAPPTHHRRVLRGVVPGIGENDDVVLWGGGVYDWFDAPTLIRAIDKLRDRRPRVRLYFLGMHHPQPVVVESRVAIETRRLSDALGLTGTHVFFNEGWVEYDDRQNYLLEADVGVSLHVDTVETSFSFRTRILDYLWASLPIVATAGDGFADIITTDRLGVVVPAHDVAAVVEALAHVLGDPHARAEYRHHAGSVSARFRWSGVLTPLVAFCADPHRAPDEPRWSTGPQVPTAALAAWPTPPAAGAIRRTVALVVRLHHEGGIGAVGRGVGRRLRRLGGPRRR
jgi:hypothetical protein